MQAPTGAHAPPLQEAAGPHEGTAAGPLPCCHSLGASPPAAPPGGAQQVAPWEQRLQALVVARLRSCWRRSPHPRPPRCPHVAMSTFQLQCSRLWLCAHYARMLFHCWNAAVPLSELQRMEHPRPPPALGHRADSSQAALLSSYTTAHKNKPSACPRERWQAAFEHHNMWPLW